MKIRAGVRLWRVQRPLQTYSSSQQTYSSNCTATEEQHWATRIASCLTGDHWWGERGIGVPLSGSIKVHRSDAPGRCTKGRFRHSSDCPAASRCHSLQSSQSITCTGHRKAPRQQGHRKAPSSIRLPPGQHTCGTCTARTRRGGARHVPGGQRSLKHGIASRGINLEVASGLAARGRGRGRG